MNRNRAILFAALAGGALFFTAMYSGISYAGWGAGSTSSCSSCPGGFCPSPSFAPAPTQAQELYRWVQVPDEPDQVALFLGAKQLGVYRLDLGAFYAHRGSAWVVEESPTPLPKDFVRKIINQPPVPPAKVDQSPVIEPKPSKIDQPPIGVEKLWVPPSEVSPGAKAKECECGGGGCKCGTECKCAATGKLCNTGCTCLLTPVTTLDKANYGVDLSRIQQHRITVNGHEVSPLVGNIGAEVPDDSAKLFLTVIGGTPEQRAKVLADVKGDAALAPYKDRLLPQAFAADAWQVKDVGFVKTGSPTVYLQSHDGKVLHRQDDYNDGAVGLAEAIRRADPNYKSEKDVDFRKPLIQPKIDFMSLFTMLPPWAWLLLGVAVFYFVFLRKKDGV